MSIHLSPRIFKTRMASTTNTRVQSPVIRRNTVRTVESGPEQHAWAGGAAGLVAGVLLYPMETVSMRYKVGGQSVLSNLVRVDPAPPPTQKLTSPPPHSHRSATKAQ